jgi:hypothetical protein
MPGSEIWAQLPVVAVLGLFLVLLGNMARLAFHELSQWQTEQNTAREQEREKQRVWMECQEYHSEEERRVRDKSWQQFFERLNAGNQSAINQLSVVSNRMVERIDALTLAITDHDQYVRRNVVGENDEAAGTNGDDAARPAKASRVRRGSK